MPTVNLKDISIEERTTIKDETFFIIKDNESNQAYFCFQNKVKEGWEELVNRREKIKEVEIEYIEGEKGKKVISLYIEQEGEVFI